MSRINVSLIAAAVWLTSAGCACAQDAAPDGGATIDQWVFGQKGVEGRMRLDAALAREIQLVHERYALTPGQRKKLELAGRRDLKRFLDRVEAMREEFRRNGQVPGDVFELNRIQRQPHTELFGEGSMLAKTLRHTLTPEQVARHETKTYRARVEWAVGLLHSRLVLAAEQRKKLVDLIVDETPPLGRYGDFDYDAIMFRLSDVPRAKLRTVLDETQCRALDLRFEQARRMKGVLVSEGYVEPAESSTAHPRHEEARR